jgi:hypothetical protein
MASAPPAALTITVEATLSLLDTKFTRLAEGVAEDRYAFWLGSGISFGRVDGLRQVIGKILEFLRSKIDHGNANCRFRRALSEALNYAAPTTDDWAVMDFTQPVATWTVKDAVISRLLTNYARLLDVTVAGEPDDYLLWEGVDVCATFADPALTPDVEHLCIAILVLEGVASTIASANWDGLIEKAVQELSGAGGILSVSGRPADLQQPQLRSRLIKFHGCAMLSRTHETEYRPFLVASWSRITSLCSRPETAALVNMLVTIISTKPTLMMGLSAQDADILAIFDRGSTQMPWTWPGDRPSYVISENELGGDQKTLLKNVYRNHIDAANREDIYDGSRIQAYAKPLLLSLVLHVLCSKLHVLIDIGAHKLPVAERSSLRAGLIAIRNSIALKVGTDKLAFLREFLKRYRALMQLARVGDVVGGAPYHPLTSDNVLQMKGNADHAVSGISELAIAIGLLGAGIADGHWSITLPLGADPHDGMLLVDSGSGTVKAFVTANVQTALELEHHGFIVPSDSPIVIQCQKRIPRMPRSPRGAPGRTGARVAREVSIASLLDTANSYAELWDQFRAEASI